MRNNVYIHGTDYRANQREDKKMSISELTITLHNDNSDQRSAEQEKARAFFRDWYGKYIIAIVTAFTALLTFVYSVYAATRIEYLPSAIILMVTLWIISVLLERSADNG